MRPRPIDEFGRRFQPWWLMPAAVATALVVASIAFEGGDVAARHGVFAEVWTLAAAFGAWRTGLDRDALGLRRGVPGAWRTALPATAGAIVVFALAYRALCGASPLDYSGSWPAMAAFQLIAVAAPEELFFRGYAQAAFRHADRSVSTRGSVDWRAVLESSALFAMAHVAAGGSVRSAATFFPGLLFGWLRERTGSLAAPILAHAAANVVITLLEGSAPKG